MSTLEIKTGVFANQSALNEFNSDLNEAFGDLTSGLVSQTYTDVITLTATEIVGITTGDIGSTNGAVLIASPGADYALEFISAILVYDFDTAAYTDGGNDLVVKLGSVAVTTAIAGLDLLLAAGNKIVQINALAGSDQALTAATPLYLKGTAYTNPGTAAGVLRCHVNYRVHLLGLA